MNCRIVVTPTFSRESKRLSKRYPSFADDFESFLLNLKENPSLGTSIGHGIHKIRFAITSKGKENAVEQESFRMLTLCLN